MERSVHGDDDEAETPPSGERHGRAQSTSAQAPRHEKAPAVRKAPAITKALGSNAG